MSRELSRRLTSLERIAPAVRTPVPVTDELRAHLIALQALVVAIMLGDLKAGADPLEALHRGIERAHEEHGKAISFRYGFARRLDHARCMALNNSGSMAVPLDWFERSSALLRHPLAPEAMPAYLQLYFDHADFKPTCSV